MMEPMMMLPAVSGLGVFLEHTFLKATTILPISWALGPLVERFSSTVPATIWRGTSWWTPGIALTSLLRWNSRLFGVWIN